MLLERSNRCYYREVGAIRGYVEGLEVGMCYWRVGLQVLFEVGRCYWRVGLQVLFEVGRCYWRYVSVIGGYLEGRFTSVI